MKVCTHLKACSMWTTRENTTYLEFSFKTVKSMDSQEIIKNAYASKLKKKKYIQMKHIFARM